MAYQIPFNEENYKPKTIEGNNDPDNPTPIEFSLSAVGSASLVRLKGLLYGSTVLTHNMEPDGRTLNAAAEGLASAGPAFVEGVDGIRGGLMVPDKLARRVGIRTDKDKSTGPCEVSTGGQFARVAPYMPELAMEIGFKLATLSDTTGAGADARLFDSPTTSPATQTRPSGTVRAARRTKGRGVTAGSKIKAG